MFQIRQLESITGLEHEQVKTAAKIFIRQALAIGGQLAISKSQDILKIHEGIGHLWNVSETSCSCKRFSTDALENMTPVSELLNADLLAKKIQPKGQRGLRTNKTSPDTLMDLKSIKHNILSCAVEVSESLKAIGGVMYI